MNKQVRIAQSSLRLGKRPVLTSYLFILPFLVLHTFVTLFPTAYSFVLSFFQYKGYGTATFVGIENYIRLLKYQVTWRQLGNTVFYFAGHYIPCLIIGFCLAYAVRMPRISRFNRLYKPLLYLPQMCASVATALVFSVVFGSRVGVINQLLGTDILFLSDLNLMKWPVVVMITWRSMGWYFLILLAGMTTVSAELTDAAKIDGASALQTIRRIYLPVMRPIFGFLTVTEVISSLKLYTEPNLLISRTSMAPYSAGPYMNLIMSNLQGASFGMASAAGWILFFIILLCTMLLLRFFKEA